METKTSEPARTLSGVDAAFLYLERKEIPLHIASVAIFDGPIPFKEFVASIEAKLDLIPRYRQVVSMPPFNLAYPTWENDRHFDIRNHMFAVHLDPPGGEAELQALAGRILSQVMDRSKPLWDIYVIDGLQNGRGGLIVRVHHALADGISGAALLKIMLDTTPEGCHPAGKTRARRRRAAAEPSLSETISKAFNGTMQNLIAAEAGVLGLAEALASERGRNGLQNLVDLLPELAASVERLPFNQPCTGERKFCWAEFDFADARAIHELLGCTINDIVLAAVTRALARYVKAHRQTITRRLVRVVCPVSLRVGDNGESLGNQISFLPVALPLDIQDPLETLRAVASRTAIMKRAHAADLVALAAGLLNAAPPPLQALFWKTIAEITLPVPLFNLICTNVPGSPVPLYAGGRRMLASYPQVPTGYELGVGIAVQSYDGRLFFGLIADAHAAPDVVRLRDFLVESFRELCRAAGVKKARRPRLRRAQPAAAPAPAPEAAAEQPASAPPAMSTAAGA